MCMFIFQSLVACDDVQMHSTNVVSSEADEPIKIYGNLIQGAMLTGTTYPNTEITVFKKTITSDLNGHFVFGVGRDAPKNLTLVLSKANGKKIKKTLDIKQRDYKTQSIEGVAKKYVSPPKKVLARIKKENGQVWLARQNFSENSFYKEAFVMPAQGPITGVYGSQRIFNGVPKRPHFGLDVAGPVGTPVVAPASGVVTLAHDDMYYSGGTLIIDHGRGISSTFIHLSKIHVEKGQEIKQGDLIGDIGATGRVTGPHLDWRVNWFNQRLDPAFFVQGYLDNVSK